MIVYRYSTKTVTIDPVEVDKMTDDRVSSKAFEEPRYGFVYGYEETPEQAYKALSAEIQRQILAADAEYKRVQHKAALVAQLAPVCTK